MERLTEKDDCGRWGLKGINWRFLYPGKVLTQKMWRVLYGALFKLKDYEETGVSPDQALRLKERNTPKRPEFEGDGVDDTGEIIIDTWTCPCCRTNYEVDYDRYFYCPNCGQKIKWSE